MDDVLAIYNASAPLAEAYTIPAPWYVDPRIDVLERRNVFARAWQMVGRLDQLTKPGDYFSTELAGEPVVVVRGSDDQIRAFYNVCRHHAMSVVNEPQGHANHLRCPYHGWTYGLDGTLKGMTEFEGVCNFDRAKNGLVSIKTATWEKFAFVSLDPQATPLEEFLGGLTKRVRPLGFEGLHFVERRSWELKCNWKVYVDNYLDGGYHVPHMHKGLSSALEYVNYTIENCDRFCVQSSPMKASDDKQVGATRRGEMAYYFWQYPNLMLNWYEGYLDTNLVLPLGIDRCQVIFDFYFANPEDVEYNRQSIAVSHRVQDEDIAICEGVQRGLNSRAYLAGRLSVRREAGEHLFHRLLAADLRNGRAVAAG